MALIEPKGEKITRTFRLDSAYDDELEREAEKQNNTTSSLIEKIIIEYLNHGRYVEQEKAITLIPKALQAFLLELDDETITQLGTSLGSIVPKEGFMMRGIPMTEDMTQILIEKILGEYDHWFTASYHEHSRPYYYLQIHIDGKWTLFIEAFLKAFYLDNFGKEVDCQRVGENLQILL